MDQFGASDGDDSQDSEEEFASSEAPAETLLKDVIDINDSLYRLATKIRNPATRLQSVKARAFHQFDTETGIDVIGVYKTLDLLHAQEVLWGYRDPKPTDPGWAPSSEPLNLNDEKENLARRLAQANTFRWQQFGYWRRDRDKNIKETADALDQLPPFLSGQKNSSQDKSRNIMQPALLPRPKTIATLSRPSTATHLQNPSRFGGDDVLSTTSVRTIAPRALDVRDEEVEVPSPPEALKREAKIGRHFQCPYCFMFCSASQLQPDAWRFVSS